MENHHLLVCETVFSAKYNAMCCFFGIISAIFWEPSSSNQVLAITFSSQLYCESFRSQPPQNLPQKAATSPSSTTTTRDEQLPGQGRATT